MLGSPEGSYRKVSCPGCSSAFWASVPDAQAASLCRKCAREAAGPPANPQAEGARGPEAGAEAGPPPVPADPLLSLQYRDLSPEDFELLLQLDAPPAPPADSWRDLLPAAPASAAWRRTADGRWRLRGTLSRAEAALLPAPATREWASEECAICLDGLEGGGGSVCALPRCGHVFHRQCLVRWLTQGRATCPLDALEVVV